ncbi:DNA-binding SARP family transcriptional activator/tetratricopeptide (TPR) repeat protein [Actinoplanes lutulentus]|uniref:DNA-binding SARP family transcriptional activator n=1 Tax=Actinoplanes lutulentus TaxID=1287878 RepID=A0A327ZLK1_9ACTN|nr:BTAD domain-containing putative transcriptional regulator [Actinoplanes lutulentus]MBB2940584.1 DNA-binding SARP family transcriptional activator/tetratricopeptide (TPR) repeat protein [Actinoplanes lutulentus]RAK42896.1 DNA-binding SARP family transcriptional activator [Actinoplanes lutulentus]
MIRFSVLGPVRAWRDGTEINLGTPQQQSLLGLLLVHAGEPVTVGHIIDVLWPAGAPASAVNVVHRYVSQIRRLLPADLLTRGTRTYRLSLDADGLDLLAFRRAAAEAAAVAATDPDRAATMLASALKLRRGPVAAGLDETVRSSPPFVRVEQELINAAVHAAALASTQESARSLLPVIRAVAAGAPLDEAVHAALLRVLIRIGSLADASIEYIAIRQRLADELGVDPSPELTTLHQQALQGDLASLRTPQAARPVPVELPTDLPTFTGRDEQIETLSTFLRGGPGAARAAVITGLGGVGKTSLAVHCAHQEADAFPDGQLYASMRGFDPSAAPTPTADVLRRFLGALGVSDHDVPADFDARVALYRSLIAGRKILVVIDNVRDSAHVRPLLPATPGSAAIITSRDPLTGLVVHEGALAVPLGLLSDAEAAAFLGRRLGPARVAGDAEAARQVMELCGGLPLALALFAARAAAHPQFKLRHLAEELVAPRGRLLDRFASGDRRHDLRAVFSWSYDLLGSTAARLFRLLALHPGSVFTASAAVSLLGEGQRHAAPLLAELSRANLVTELAPGRFHIHDLVRAYSDELLAEQETPVARQAAERRLHDHYLHSVLHAGVTINPFRAPDAVGAPEVGSGVTPEEFVGYEQASSWLRRERGSILAMVERAVADGADLAVGQYAWALENFLQRAFDWPTLGRLLDLALAAGQRHGNPALLARTHHGAGVLFSSRALNVPDRSRRHFVEAVRLFAVAGDVHNQMLALLWLARQDGADGSSDRMIEQLRDAVELYEEIVKRDGAGDAPEDLVAAAFVDLGDYPMAIHHGRRAVAWLRKVGDRHREANTWRTLGEAYAAMGDWPQSVAADERAVLLYEEVGDAFITAQTLDTMSRRYADGRRALLARTAARRATALRIKIGAHPWLRAESE